MAFIAGTLVFTSDTIHQAQEARLNVEILSQRGGEIHLMPLEADRGYTLCQNRPGSSRPCGDVVKERQ